MTTCNSSNRWFGGWHRSLYAVAVGCVLTVSAGAHGGGQPEANLADQINKRLTKGRVVNVEPPLLEAPVIPLSLLEAFPNATPDMFETMPVGVPIVTIEFPNNEAVEAGLVDSRGITATGGTGEMYVFYQRCDSGFAHFLKADDTLDYGTWSTQAIFGNAFEPGMAISGYDFLMYNSEDSVNDGAWTSELWDGDPFAVLDTVCNGGNPQPIPGTTATFGPLPNALDACPGLIGNAQPTCVGLYRLRATLPDKVAINCDRVWIVVTMTQGCRSGWRISKEYSDYSGCSSPYRGFQNGYAFSYACEQYGACDTASGYNSGTCCNSGAACDFTDADPANWTVDGVARATCSFDPQDRQSSSADATFCGDGTADFVEAQDDSPEGYLGYVASIYAPTEIALQWQPKTASLKDGSGDLVEAPSEVIGNEIILYKGGVNVMLELQVNDWSGPDGTTRLTAFQASLDTNGFSNGLGGPLTEKRISCTSDEECVAAFGGFCSIFGNSCRQDDDCSQFPIETCEGSECVDWPSRLRGYCAPGYVATKRPDFCLVHTDPVAGVDVSVPEYRFGSAGFDLAGEAFGDLDLTAKDGKAYMGTLWLEVPDNAKGSYTVGLRPAPDTRLNNQRPYPDLTIQLVGQIPGKITVLDCRGTDCQANGIPDDCEIERGLTEDCNGNAIPDECDIDTGATTDCNENRIPDECDIAEETSQDCNGNQIPDDCEPDCDGNGVADDCEEDSDGDGVIDACDECPDDADMISPGICGCGLLNVDSDLDTVPDCVDQCPGMDDRIDHDEDGAPDCLDPVPALSAWGLVIFALLLLAGGKIYFGRRRSATL